MAAGVLEVRGLRVAYGGVVALDGLSLSVAQGQAVALLGANGAGKSSALRAIGGLQRPAGGEIVFEGRRLDGLPTEALVRRGVLSVPDTRDLFPRCTVAENLRLGAYSRRGGSASQQAEVFALFPSLERHLRRQVWTLSGGEQQMVALARALLASPRLLLLDEPSLGLAPLVVTAIFAALARVVANGTAILLAEQSTGAALRLADYAYVLRNGQVALEGSGAELRHNPRVLDLYLGGMDLS